MASQDWFEKDFYQVLGVSKDVSDAELKKTYRKLARKYHPDSNPGDAAAEAKFKEISEAHSVLSDPEQRKEYDAIRAMGSGARFTAPGSAGVGASGSTGAGGAESGSTNVMPVSCTSRSPTAVAGRPPLASASAWDVPWRSVRRNSRVVPVWSAWTNAKTLS